MIPFPVKQLESGLIAVINLREFFSIESIDPKNPTAGSIITFLTHQMRVVDPISELVRMKQMRGSNIITVTTDVGTLLLLNWFHMLYAESLDGLRESAGSVLVFADRKLIVRDSVVEILRERIP